MQRRGRGRVIPRTGNENWRNPRNVGDGSDTNQNGTRNFSRGNRHFSVERDGNHWQRRNRTSSTSSEQSQNRNYNTNEHHQSRRGNFRNTGEDEPRRNEHHQSRRGGFKNTSEEQPRQDSNNRQQYRPRHMGFRALEELLKKSSEELIMDLLNSRKGFGEFLKLDLTDDAIVLVTKVLKKVCDSSFEENKYKVLQSFFDDPFDTILTNYIMRLPLQDRQQKFKNKYFWNDTDEFWNNVLGICGDILDTVPTFAIKVLPKILKALHVYIPTFEAQHNFHVSDAIKENVRKLYDTVETMVKENEEKEKQKARNKLLNETVEEPPPDDFRQISVYPDSHELISNRPVYLRPNVVKGPYRDVNHYLDVQFRLLREDFVRPLRTGIEMYRSETKKRPENVKVFKKVRFLNHETINEYYCIRLQFDFSNKKMNFRYENSRRFMFGSLLCFTRDNFKTFLFGRVAERKEDDLKKAQLIVAFDENVPVLYQTDYVMIECSVFFEPYFHVLNVLKKMAVENFPMEKYIIYVDPSVAVPEYLKRDPDRSYLVHYHEFLPLTEWPTTRFYNLNDSQLRAFQAALTQEYAIIQGPPGTGKTYLGLKIARTLLDNRDLWYKETPMLVICFTNHALDQFLEGILSFTERILRVGSQSKNERLKPYNLKNTGKYKMNPAVYEQRNKVQNILKEIKAITENLKDINLYNSVRRFDVFEDVVPNYRTTWFYQKARNDHFVDWLLGAKDVNINLPSPAEQHALMENMDMVGQQLKQMKITEVSVDEDSNSDSYDDEEIINDDDIFEEVLNALNVECSSPLITLNSIQYKISQNEDLMATLDQKWTQERPTFEEYVEYEKSAQELMSLNHKYNHLKMRLDEGKNWLRNDYEVLPRLVDLENPFNMHPDDRWKLYFQWLNLYINALNIKLRVLNERFRDEFKAYEEMRNIENLQQMRDAYVIGMTTTGAARLRTTIQALKSPIVIVEEAAEVLEAHIVTSLTKHCEHLILIGDHQQLKPSTADYKIETNYNLGVSLFERMVVNNIQCYTLNVQHRMRPEIANLIRPTIYPSLEDHESVLDRPPIRGVDNNLFFIDHKNREDECEGTSKKNFHEVKFFIAFARHLILNGYKPENITILAAYLGQMYEMQKERKYQGEILQNVRISVLDNYQGEECDIILLSLVRNNPDNKIGFLSIENRVCVALSRAKNGLYVMGNMTQLCEASKLWRDIRKTLEDQNALGPQLPLRCQVHHTITNVENSCDFLNIPEGGCAAKCEADLACGHKCTSFCHILDRDHKQYKCRSPCTKRLCDDENHMCRKMCHEDCGPCTYFVPRKLPCQHEVNLECHIDPDTYQCQELVPTQLPCGHRADKPCCADPAVFQCPHPCDFKVEPCGHACLMRCHVRKDPDHLQYKCRKPCARYLKDCTVKTEKHLCRKLCYEECDQCTILVKKGRTVCPHYHDVPCHFNVDELVCERPCTKLLECGHKCKNKCNEPCGACEVKVEKTISPCGHTVKIKCSAEPDRKLCSKKCPLELPCGHPCTKKCNERCTTNCSVLVDCTKQPPCGHIATKVPCHVATSTILQDDPKSLLKYCNNPCTDQLKCGHKCTGTCGECTQGRVHKRCAENCGVPLVCDHLCEFPCRQACRPCAKQCPYRCKHSKCRKKCGEVCTPCKEKCARECPHQKCTKKCGDYCDVPPCKVPCLRRLKSCGHFCIGFCGDPCPQKCLICDKEEVTEIFFGNEEDEDARFVVLEDCGHIFESEGLEQWLQQDEDQISFKTCPRCKTPIKKTQRYSDQIKKAMADVAKVKAKSNGSHTENEESRNKLFVKLHTLKASSGVLSLLCPELKKVFQITEDRLEKARRNKRQPINKHDLNAITSKLQILEHIVKICCKTDVQIRDANEIYFPQVKFISKILLREEDHITDQEIDDINFELNRLSRIVEYSRIKSSVKFKSRIASEDRVKRAAGDVERWIFGLGKFYQHDEDMAIEVLKDLDKLLASGIGISEIEKREIVRAMGLQRGHWYKCPNGHPYVITECGGAMVESTCNECGARIGGQNHRLLDTNAVATEMDGASHGAWTEAANLANFDLRNLF